MTSSQTTTNTPVVDPAEKAGDIGDHEPGRFAARSAADAPPPRAEALYCNPSELVIAENVRKSIDVASVPGSA